MDGETGHIKMTRVFRTSIITQLNKITKNFLTPNGKLNQKFYKKHWNMLHVRFIRWHISPYLYIISGVWCIILKATSHFNDIYLNILLFACYTQ